MINIIIIQLAMLRSSVMLVSKPHNNHSIDDNIGDDIKKFSRYDYHGTRTVDYHGFTIIAQPYIGIIIIIVISLHS